MILLKLLAAISPWPLKRWLLQTFFGYRLHRRAKIGLAWVFPARLTMKEGARIDHFTTAIHLDEIIMEKDCSIGRSNWITGFSSRKPSRHFAHQPERVSRLVMHEGAAITKQHHIDCTSPIEIGRFSTIAGYQSQLLTHSIDIIENRQHSEPISIGAYCFVSTNVVVLGGALLPDYAVLGAKSLLNKSFEESYWLYAGVPAVPIKPINTQAQYFHRTQPFVY